MVGYGADGGDGGAGGLLDGDWGDSLDNSGGGGGGVGRIRLNAPTPPAMDGITSPAATNGRPATLVLPAGS